MIRPEQHEETFSHGLVLSGKTSKRQHNSKVGPEDCLDGFKHEDLSAEHQEDNIYRACQIDEKSGPDGKVISIKPPVFLGPDYRYSIHWIPRCVTTVPEQKIWAPIPDDSSGTRPACSAMTF